MSTANPPRRDTEIRQPQLGPLGWARWVWRNLTSMRTALFLLLLLSVAAVPGSIFPQRTIDPGRVGDYLVDNPTTGPWLDRLGFFNVYTSPWFSAIYLLLLVSLIGCIIPRSRLHWHAIRSRPPRAPARLDRLAAHTTFTYAVPPAEALAAASTALRRRRYRVHSHDESSVSAEVGFLRETGNLLFHVAICVVIVGVAVGHLFGWRGDVIVTEGETFGFKYDLNIRQADAFGQIEHRGQQWEVYGALNLGTTTFWRTGFFRNGLFADNSEGDSEKQSFFTYGLKGGATYKINGRHYVTANAVFMTRPPVARSVYVSPRTRDEVIAAVWPEAVGEGVSEQAIDALVRRLRDRLAEIDADHQYLVTVRGHGFRLDNPIE